MDVKVIGRVRKLAESFDAASQGDENQQLTLTPQLEQLVAPGAAPYREIIRPGRAFQVHTAAAIAAVVAIPTTGHMLALWNGEADGGRSYVIDWIAASGVAKSAAAGQQQMLALVGQQRDAEPADSGLVITRMNGLGSIGRDSRAKTILNATGLSAQTGVAANWFPWGPSVGNPGAAATPGNGLWVPVDGRIIVPPGRFFAVHVLSDVIGNTFLAYIGWHEAQLVLG